MEEDEEERTRRQKPQATTSALPAQSTTSSAISSSRVIRVTHHQSTFQTLQSQVASFDDTLLKSQDHLDRAKMLIKSGSDGESDTVYLKAETASQHASRSMECLKEHRSFITSSERDVRRIASTEHRFRRTVSGEEEVDRKRGLFATGGRTVPCHLSLAPPTFERKLTILSPGWNVTGKNKKNVTLPRLILPTPDQTSWR